MAANVETMFYAGKEKPWHGLGVQVPAECTAEEAIKHAGLDWTVEKKPLYHHFPEAPAGTRFHEIKGSYGVRRSDNGHIVGIVGENYTCMQNSKRFAFADGIIQEKAAVYHTAGSLGQGEKVWLLAKLDGVCTVKGDDTIEKYLLFSGSNDGSSAERVCITPIRVVCQNTLNQAIASASNVFKIRHTKNMGDKVAAAREALGLANKFFSDFEAKARALAGVQLKAEDLKGYFKAVGFDVEAEKGRAAGQLEDLNRLFESGKGQNLDGARGTAWGAYNAVTEYLTHERGTRVTDGYKSEDEARLNSLWFGSSQALNQKAWDKALALV